MAHVVFYEKPGCINNTRQKRALEESGHVVDARDIRAEAWTPERLKAFFERKPVAEWFNPSAPRVKSGEIRPAAMAPDLALAEMCADPLLIRRPLMTALGRCVAGFDEVFIATWIGLDIDHLVGDACPRQDGESCEEPERR